MELTLEAGDFLLNSSNSRRNLKRRAVGRPASVCQDAYQNVGRIRSQHDEGKWRGNRIAPKQPLVWLMSGEESNW
jgi:hypothetical protein